MLIHMEDVSYVKTQITKNFLTLKVKKKKKKKGQKHHETLY